MKLKWFLIVIIIVILFVLILNYQYQNKPNNDSIETAERLIEAGLQEGDKIIKGDKTFMISPIGLIEIK